MKKINYPDGSSYVKEVATGLHNNVFRINSYEDLWTLHQAVDAYNNSYEGARPTITIPNLIDAQADRRFGHDQPHSLKLVCEFLNSMNADFKIFHPHNQEVVEALMDNVEIIGNERFIANVLGKVARPKEQRLYLSTSVTCDILKDDLILMSSDAGGFKPLMKLCDTINWRGETYSASKSRKHTGEKSVLTQFVDRQDFNGKDILIIDDICVYGGTFKGLAKLLRERNCGKLYLAVSHMTVQNLGEDPVTNYFDTVFTTNSKYDNYYSYKGGEGDITPKNLEIIKIF